MILYRCFPWDRRVDAAAPGGPLWFPRRLQGEGRHDGPEHYGCLYVSEEPLSAVVEELARFGGTRLADADLRRSGLPLALAVLVLADSARLIDLDNPLILAAAKLRPSLVASSERPRTQAVAKVLHDGHEGVAGLRWWSGFASQWANVTLFDSALDALSLEDVRPLELRDEIVIEAARHLALRTAA